MTNRDFENYLALVSRLLRLKRGQSEQIAVELRDHLELRVAELVQSGTDPDEATRRALEEFGDAASLAGQFQFITESYQKRWMMRFATLSVAGLFLAAVLTMAMWPGQARFGAPDSLVAKDMKIANDMGAISAASDDEITMSDNTRRNIEIRKVLMAETSCDFAETEFAEVMDFLANENGFNVVLDMSARDDSLQEDTPITFKVNGIPLSKAMNLMLREHNATYMVNGGVVRIISMDVAPDPDYFSRQIFDVSNLLEQLKQLEKHRIGKMKRVSTGAGLRPSGGGGGGGIFCVPCQATPQETEQELPSAKHNQSAAGGDLAPEKAADRLPAQNTIALGGGGEVESPDYEVITAEKMLIDLVKTTVAADSWRETNGDGTLEILGGLMIVHQSEAINEAVGELLQDLNYRYSVILNNKD